jgi:putative endonuclease
MDNKRKEGERYEYRAERYLIEKGYLVVDRNYRTRYGEIDRIMCRDGVVAFVEVKMRHGKAFGSAAEAVDERKQKQLWSMAEQYVAEHPEMENNELRFDVVAIDLAADGMEELTHFENVIEDMP